MAKSKNHRWKKFTHNWSWWDSVVGFLLGAPVWGLLALWYWGHGVTAGRLFTDWGHRAVIVFLMVILMGRIVAIARWPRTIPLDYNKITFPGVIAANFVTIILGVILIICTLALVAPGVLEILAKHQS